MGSGGTYKLIKKLSTIATTYNPATFFIPGSGTWYYTFTPSNTAYKLGYRDQTANNDWLNIQSVSAVAYDDDNPNGIGGSITPAEGASSFQTAGNSLGFINTSDKVRVTVTNNSWNEGEFELTLVPVATTALSVTTATGDPVSHPIAQNEVRHYGFIPPTTTATYNFTWDYPTGATNPPTISDVRAYTYTLGDGGLSASTTLTQNTASNLNSPFTDARTRVLVEVEDGSATAGTRNFTLTVRQQ
jgi:hypothetical protein